tara:strand:+ start:7 stop:264 length:258 start_codon:yes stop_codon:yes gene_type:complete
VVVNEAIQKWIMKHSEVNEYRETVLLMLGGLEKTAEQHTAQLYDITQELKEINGRVRKNTESIQHMKGIGAAITGVFAALFGWYK